MFYSIYIHSGWGVKVEVGPLDAGLGPLEAGLGPLEGWAGASGKGFNSHDKMRVEMTKHESK